MASEAEALQYLVASRHRRAGGVTRRQRGGMRTERGESWSGGKLGNMQEMLLKVTKLRSGEATCGGSGRGGTGRGARSKRQARSG